MNIGNGVPIAIVFAVCAMGILGVQSHQSYLNIERARLAELEEAHIRAIDQVERDGRKPAPPLSAEENSELRELQRRAEDRGDRIHVSGDDR